MTELTEAAIGGGTKEQAQTPFLEQVKSFARPFWAANAMELVERLAYWGMRVPIPIYIASTEDPGGLHFTNIQKGQILTVWAFIQALLPMFTGGYADRYGRKRTIAVALSIDIAGYLLMGTQRTFGGFLFACAVLATGTAIFKPGVQGTLVCGTTRKNSSVGWGIFYQVVNIGGFLGPPIVGALHHVAWRWVFFACAGVVACNFLLLFTYTDKRGEGEAPKELTQGTPWQVFTYSMKRLFRLRLISFIVIMGGFWLMFMQLYDMLPNFIDEWTDTGGVVAALGLHEGRFAQATSRGLQVPIEWMINIDAGAIVLLMLAIAYVGGRFRRLVSIFVGIFVASGGLLLCGVSMTGVLCMAGILTFAIGEMLASPKMNEYLGVIAPKGEEALYMGYANIPFAIGWTSADYLGGLAYDRLADKANLATRYLGEHALLDPAALSALKRTDAMKALMEATHLDASHATELLWTTYHPQTVWYPFVAAGVITAFAMVIYARVARRWAHENA